MLQHLSDITELCRNMTLRRRLVFSCGNCMILSAPFDRMQGAPAYPHAFQEVGRCAGRGVQVGRMLDLGLGSTWRVGSLEVAEEIAHLDGAPRSLEAMGGGRTPPHRRLPQVRAPPSRRLRRARPLQLSQGVLQPRGAAPQWRLAAMRRRCALVKLPGVRPIGRPISGGRSVVRQVGWRPLGALVGRSFVRSVGRSIGQQVGRWGVCWWTGGRGADPVVASSMGPLVGGSLSAARSVDRSVAGAQSVSWQVGRWGSCRESAPSGCGREMVR